jgi:uncharacterized protein
MTKPTAWLQMLAAALTACCFGSALAQASADCPPAAQPPSAEQLRAGLRDARDRGFLWRISKGGRDSWLYGTVHVARTEWMYPGPALTRALKASDTIALELDLADPDVQRRMTAGMAARPDAPPLPEALTQRLQQRSRAECIPPTALAALMPEMQIATLMSLAGRREGLDPSYGIDAVLAGWGHAAKKPVVSLETPELQLQLLQAGSWAETSEFVANSLDELDSGRAVASLTRVAQVWADADLGTLSRYESWCGCLNTAADRAAMTRLLDDRNPALADSIAALHARGQRVFAAVGSLHMVGASGLPALLAQRGFKVEPVAFAR